MTTPGEVEEVLSPPYLHESPGHRHSIVLQYLARPEGGAFQLIIAAYQHPYNPYSIMAASDASGNELGDVRLVDTETSKAGGLYTFFAIPLSSEYLYKNQGTGLNLTLKCTRTSGRQFTVDVQLPAHYVAGFLQSSHLDKWLRAGNEP